MRLFRAAFLAVFLLSGFALAESAADCPITPDIATTRLLHCFPWLHVVNLTGQPATGFIEAFNALPPPSHVVGDQALIFRDGKAGVYEVAIFLRGCLVAHSADPAGLIEPPVGQGG